MSEPALPRNTTGSNFQLGLAGSIVLVLTNLPCLAGSSWVYCASPYEPALPRNTAGSNFQLGLAGSIVLVLITCISPASQPASQPSRTDRISMYGRVVVMVTL